MSEAKREGLEQRALVLAPTGKDATNSQSVLGKAGLACAVCRDMEELCREIEAGAGAVLLTEEALAGEAGSRLAEALNGQPAWSDLPVALLTRGGPESPAALRATRALGNVLLLERPVRVSTLVTAMRSALRARQRQYEVRDHMARLREADRRKDDFLALLAHELRNPLAPLRNGLQVLRLARDADQAAAAREMMDRQLAHMVRLIDDLLDVSRLNRNKLHLRRSRVTLAEGVGAAVEAARPVVEEAGHTLALALPAEPVYLDADLTRLAQVFGNLLTNSAKYTPRGGRVWLSAEARGGWVEVTVRDTGIGIPAGELPRIFDMFSQVDRSIERSTGGLGIGLALVKGLVEMHGGTVTAYSEGEGKGSTFTVRLPVLAVGKRGGGPAEGARDNGPSRRILVVDDNRDSAESMAMMLRLLGNEVRTAHDGLEAVEAARESRPDVVLMDLGMPRLNGLEATRRIREQPWGRSMKVIALTGWGQDGDRRRTVEAGCDGHLVKPVSLDDLQRMLDQAARG